MVSRKNYKKTNYNRFFKKRISKIFLVFCSLKCAKLLGSKKRQNWNKNLTSVDLTYKMPTLYIVPEYELEKEASKEIRKETRKEVRKG